MNTKKIAGTGLFAALTIVFTLISNYVQIGTVSINLSLIPIAIAGIMYGPLAGFLVGLVNGGFVMLAPSTAAFFGISVYGTIIVCLLKSSLAGLISAILYKLISKKNDLVGMIIASLVVPFINTGLFICGALIFFSGTFGNLISIFISVNFLIEFGVTLILAPATAKAIKQYTKNNKNKCE